ncbi:MAG: 1-deoxy-D-xylulose-5-phosphate reductoisomerase [Xanthobacteraceae bacterium]|nr:1-deoxy-D-xylulose-5-phosphate reductoisomerase [Xanthobacteraceae bacterium]
MVTSVSILGATGSIGTSTLDLVREGGFRIIALTANSDAKKLAALAKEFNAEIAAVSDESAYAELKSLLSGTRTKALGGASGMIEAASAQSDILLSAIVGAAGLAPTVAGFARGRKIALANKECLLTAGSLFMREARNAGATVLPVDSEHNAVFQALACGKRDAVKRVTLTASGGPFRTLSRERLALVTPEEAVRHPNWSMGAKISIDSATLMNKGLELIEAHYLFDLLPDQLETLVHPQSVVHALVEFHDGSVVAQMAHPDMRIPIGFCLAWPERMQWQAPRLDLAKIGSLHFEAPDHERFPALFLARAALDAGGAAPNVLNAANEVAIDAFRARRLSFPGIPALTGAVMEKAQREGLYREVATVNDALGVDHVARSLAATLLPQFAAKAS